jgi:hypothetical protein
MDPLTITTAALGFAAICTRTVKLIKDTVSRVQDLPQTLSNLERSIDLMTTLLSVVEIALKTDHGTLTDKSLEERLIAPLDGCRKALERLLPGLEDLGRTQRWTRKIGVLWKENPVAQMVADLDQERRHLRLIVDILNM